MQSQSSRTMSNESIAIACRNIAAQWQRSIADDPEGEWPPMLAVQYDDGRIAVPHMPPDLAYTENGRYLLAEYVATIVSDRSAMRAAFMSSSYSAQYRPNADGSPVHIADRPIPREASNRREIVMLHVIDQDSEESWHATVERVAGMGPVLGEWRLQGRDVEVRGKFVDAVRCVRIAGHG